MATTLVSTLPLHAAAPKPLTARTDATLATLATRTQRTDNNGQSEVWIYFLDGHRTVELVVSRRVGRVVRGFATTPEGPIVLFRGTATQICSTALAWASDGR